MLFRQRVWWLSDSKWFLCFTSDPSTIVLRLKWWWCRNRVLSNQWLMKFNGLSHNVYFDVTHLIFLWVIIFLIDFSDRFVVEGSVNLLHVRFYSSNFDKFRVFFYLYDNDFYNLESFIFLWSFDLSLISHSFKYIPLSKGIVSTKAGMNIYSRELDKGECVQGLALAIGYAYGICCHVSPKQKALVWPFFFASFCFLFNIFLLHFIS